MWVETLPFLTRALVLGHERVDFFRVLARVPQGGLDLTRAQVLQDVTRALDALVARAVDRDDFPHVEPREEQRTPRWTGRWADRRGLADYGGLDALLVIEVADTSIDHDRTRKLQRYALAGVAEVWIVNLGQDLVEVYRRLAGGEYRERFAAGPGQSLSIPGGADRQVAVDDFAQ